jgi:antitoxin ParD1/3/4
MPTRIIVLTDRQDSFVEELLDSGRYKSASEVIHDSLRLLENSIERREAELSNIRAGIVEGIRQADNGDFAEDSAEDVIKCAFSHARTT